MHPLEKAATNISLPHKSKEVTWCTKGRRVNHYMKVASTKSLLHKSKVCTASKRNEVVPIKNKRQGGE